MQITINITDQDVVRDIKTLATFANKSFEEMLHKIVIDGTKDKCYRKHRNMQKWQEQKQQKETVKRLEEKLRELGVEVE